MRRFAVGVSLGLALVAIASGLSKVFSSDFRGDMNAVFEVNGEEFGGWFFLIVGLIEIAIGATIVYQRTRIPGAIAYANVMVGAIIFNTVFAKDEIPEGLNDPGDAIVPNIVLLLFSLGIAALWRNQGDEGDIGINPAA